jgi:neutral ceramidase
MRYLSMILFVGLTWVSCEAAEEADWRAGIARREITPSGPIWMGGYAARQRPSEGVLQPLWAKALVLEDHGGSRAAIVTMDLIGIDRRLAEAVCRRAGQKTGMPRERIVLNCSHTHSGPVVAGVTPLVYNLDAQQQAAVTAYAQTLEDNLVQVIEAAASDLRPATLAFGEGQCGFAANRRAQRVQPQAAATPPAPVDHGVPVLVVRGNGDSLRAVLFGYACHNTTLAIYQINGDYAGFAQAALEELHPGAIALFMIGCGADCNPHPRSEVELARQHGKTLAAAVEAVLPAAVEPLRGPLEVGFEQVDLKLVDPPGKEELEHLSEHKNVYQQRLAKYLLGELAAGRALPTSCSCPVQVIRFGDDLLMAALGGEACVDYALRLRREFAGRRIWIASYSNDVFAYLPSERVLQEGGYEGGAAMVYFGLHGPFQPGVEQRVIDAVKRLAAKR